MAKKKHDEQADGGTLEEKIRQCAEKCGLTEAEAHEAMGAGMVGAPGDRIVKLFEFLSKIWPLIAPFIFKGKPDTPAP
jgi:hypothetical protein